MGSIGIEEVPAPGYLFKDGLPPLSAHLGVLPVEVVQPGLGGDDKARVLHALGDGHAVTLVHIAAAGAALDGAGGARAEQRHPAARGQGQHMLLVLQQYHALGSGAARQGGMGRFIIPWLRIGDT